MKKDEHILTAISQTSCYTKKAIIDLFEIVRSYDDIIMLIELGARNNQQPIYIYQSLKAVGSSVKAFYDSGVKKC